MATYAYARTRSQFGRQIRFVDKPAELLTTIETNVDMFDDYIPRNPVHQATQSTASMSLSEVSTFVIG